MTGNIGDLDHLVLQVEDLDSSSRDFERMGFRLTPKGDHGKTLGTANRCVMLQGAYLELIGIVSRTKFNESFRAVLATYGEGVTSVGLATPSAAKAQAALRSAGLLVDSPTTFERPIDQGDGTTQRASFSVALLPEGLSPGVRYFVCQHHTPELIAAPHWLQHPNRASRIRRCIVGCADVVQAAAACEKIFGLECIVEVPDGFHVRTAGAALGVLSWAAIEGIYREIAVSDVARRTSQAAVVQVVVDSLPHLAAMLTRNGVPHTAGPDRTLRVSQQAGHGLLLEFQQD